MSVAGETGRYRDRSSHIQARKRGYARAGAHMGRVSAPAIEILQLAGL
jgi:hypothetical protein